MSKIDKLKEKYVADTELMASKSRFGYFSLLPSHTAAITDASAPAPHRESDGKVHTEPRNIYPGATSTGSLKKNYFSYTPSAFHGTPFQDPGKIDRKLELEQSKKWQGKQIYKPASLNQTVIKSSYQYISNNDPAKKKKNLRDSSGKVITQSSNVLISPQSKIDFLKNKEYRYIECPPPKREEKKEEVKQNHHQEAFKIGNPKKELFTSNTQAFFDADIKKSETVKKQLTLNISHEAPFKPSCISPGKNFTPVVYKQEGHGKEEVKPAKKEPKHQQPFKLTKVEQISKPTPSISLSKTNLLRGYR